MSTAVDRENPWPGLDAFSEEMGAFFYGREAEKEDLFRLIKRAHLVTLFGQSGLGKTSLIYAGLLPLLRQAYCLPVNIRLDFAEASPPLIQQVRKRLLKVTQAQGVECPEFPPEQTLWEYLHRSDVDFWSADNHPLTPVFVFDQFEEIFTIGSSSRDPKREAELEILFEQLSDLIENRYPAPLRVRIEEDPAAILPFETDKQNFRILLSLREDYLPHLEDLKSRFSDITENRLRLNRMSGARALESTLGAGGPLITPDVAAKVVRFVAADRRWQEESKDTHDLASLQVEPSLLSVICQQLNYRRQAQGLPVITADLLTGTRDQILEDLYRRTVSDLPRSAAILVEDKLITESGYRDSLALENALRLGGMNRGIIDELVDRRLLRLEERFGILRIELMHDVLTGVAQRNRLRRKFTDLGLYGINYFFILIAVVFLGIFFVDLPQEWRERQWMATAAAGDEESMDGLINGLKRTSSSGFGVMPGWLNALTGGFVARTGLPAARPSLAGSDQPARTGHSEISEDLRDHLNRALWAAATQGNNKVLVTLIHAGADETATAGYRALINGRFVTARMFFPPGLKSDATKTDDFAVAAGKGLTYAVRNDDLNLAELILQNGFDLKKQYHGGAPYLLVALERGNRAMAELLLLNGADPLQTGENDSVTPAAWATANNSPLLDLLPAAPAPPQPAAEKKP